MHFFNPVPIMKLLELVRHERTSQKHHRCRQGSRTSAFWEKPAFSSRTFDGVAMKDIDEPLQTSNGPVGSYRWVNEDISDARSMTGLRPQRWNKDIDTTGHGPEATNIQWAR